MQSVVDTARTRVDARREAEPAPVGALTPEEIEELLK